MNPIVCNVWSKVCEYYLMIKVHPHEAFVFYEAHVVHILNYSHVGGLLHFHKDVPYLSISQTVIHMIQSPAKFSEGLHGFFLVFGEFLFQKQFDSDAYVKKAL